MKKLLLAMLPLAALLIACPVHTYAQGKQDQKISIDFDKVDVRDAIKQIFTKAGLNYTIANDVQGTVTAMLKDVPFETALSSLVKQVDATYKVEASIYAITLRKHDSPPPQLLNDPAVKPPSKRPELHRLRIMHADPELLYLLATGKANFDTEPEISSKNIKLPGSGNSQNSNGGGGGFFQGADRYFYYIGDLDNLFGGGGSSSSGNGGFGSGSFGSPSGGRGKGG